MPRPNHVYVRLLGSFAVDIDNGRPISVPIKLRKSRALIAYLALKPNYQASRDELATLFWGDHSDTHARQSLRQCLTSLRQDLRLAPDLLIVERNTIALQSEVLSVDVFEF